MQNLDSLQKLSWQYHAETVKISDALRRLEIEYPDISQDDRDFVSLWFDFLVRLAPLAQHKDIAEARRVCRY